MPGEGSGELSEGKLTGDNWHPLNMACGTRTLYPGEQNKGLSLTFQPQEGWSVQQLKRCDKHGNKDEDNSPKNVNNVYKEDLTLNYQQWLIWYKNPTKPNHI